ncbi:MULTISPECIES: hypothetical protein [unclassified Streptomyces]|uniref:hypothetical protein n=1 Tax=unclassified Streptomyces TaxID=2593676 RepID=UPI0037FF1554
MLPKRAAGARAISPERSVSPRVLSEASAGWLNETANTLTTAMQGAADDARQQGIQVWFSDPTADVAGQGVCGNPEQIHGLVKTLTNSDNPIKDWWILKKFAYGLSAQSFHPKIGARASTPTLLNGRWRAWACNQRHPQPGAPHQERLRPRMSTCTDRRRQLRHQNGYMTVKWALPALSAVSDALARALGLLLILVLSACSSQDRATSAEEVRKLAGSPQSQQARKAAEERLWAVVNVYAQHTPLTLGLVTVSDICAGGKARELFFQTGDDQYKVRCDMRITAYYGGDPRHIGDVLDGILTAGDHASSDSGLSSALPFHHRNGSSPLVAYYRGNGPNPNGPNSPEPTVLFVPGQTLSWDSVRSSQKTLIGEPDACLLNNSPVTRCLREPASKTVADLRKQHGMVFKPEIPAVTYYRVYKDGKTSVSQ